MEVDFDKAVLDPDGFYNGLEAGDKAIVDKALTFDADKKAGLRTFLAMGKVAKDYNADPRDVASKWSSIVMPHYAANVLQSPEKPKDDGQFFSQLQDKVRDEAKKQDQMSGAYDAGTIAALQGKGTDAVSEWQASPEYMASYDTDPNHADEMNRAFMQAHQSVANRLDVHAPEIDSAVSDILGAAKATKGTDNSFAGWVARTTLPHGPDTTPESTNEKGSFDSAAKTLLSIPPKDRPAALDAVKARLEAKGADVKTFMETLGDHIASTLPEFSSSVMAGVGRAALVRQASVIDSARVPVDSTNPVGDALVDTATKLTGTWGEGGMGGSLPAPFVTGREMRPLTEEEKSQAHEAINNQLDALDLRDRAKGLAAGTINPLTSHSMIARGAFGTIDMLPMIGAAMLPGGNMTIVRPMLEDSIYQKFIEQPGMTREKAVTLANVAAVPAALAFEFHADALLGKTFPALEKWVGGAALTNKAALGQFALRSGVALAGGTVAMKASDAAAPIVQGMAHAMGADVPAVPEGTFAHWLGSFEDNTIAAISFLPLIAVGAGTATLSEMKRSRAIVGDADALIASGYKPDAAPKIVDLWNKGDVEGAQDLMRASFDQANLAAPAAQDAVGRIIQRQKDAQAATSRMEAVGMLPKMERAADDSGFIVTTPDGKSAKFDSLDEAQEFRWKHNEELTKAVNAATRAFIDQTEKSLRPGESRQIEFTGKHVRVEDAMTPEQAKERIAIADTLEPLQEQHDKALAMGDPTGADAVWSVLGSNRTEIAGDLANVLIKLNQGATLHTLIEEHAETTPKKLIADGKRDWLLQNLRDVEDKIRSQELANGQEPSQLFPSPDTASDQEIIEAYSHLEKAYASDVLARKETGLFAKGADKLKSYLRALRRAVANSKLSTLLDATMSMLSHVYRRADVLRQLKDSGKFNGDIEDLIHQSLGLEQPIHEKAVVDEAREIAEGIVMHPDGTISMQISQPVLKGELPEAGELKATMEKAGYKLTALNTWEKKTSQGKIQITDVKPSNFMKLADGLIVPVDVITTLAKVEPESYSIGRGQLDSRLSKIFDPFQRSPKLRAELGLEMQRRLSAVRSDHESANFGRGKITIPGLDAVAAEDWVAKRAAEIATEKKTELSSEVLADSARELKDVKDPTERQRVKDARQTVRDLETASRQQARAEAPSSPEFAAEQSKKTVAWLRTLDAVLSVLPPEVQKQIGGYIQMAKLTTDAQRLGEITRRIGKIDTALEKYLREEIGGQFDKLLTKAEPKGGAGEKTGGKIGVEGHRYFKEINALKDLTTDEVDAKREAILKAIEDADSSDTAKLLDLSERLQMLEAFGNMGDKSAQDLSKSLELAQSIYDTGRNAWRALEESRLETVKHLQQLAKVGGAATDATLKASKKRSRSALQMIKDGAVEFLSFTQVLEGVFGRNNELTKRWHESNLKAAGEKQDAINRAHSDFRDLLATIYGEKMGALERARRLWDLRTKDSITVNKTEGRKTDTVTLPIDKAQDVLDGKVKPETVGLNAGHLDELRNAVEVWSLTDSNDKASMDRKQSISLEVVRNAGEATATPLTPMEAVYITQLARQKRYAKALERNGWTKDALAEIEAQLSPEAKMLRQWMQDRYAEGYQGLNEVHQRMYGIDLPQEENYAPARFEHDAMEAKPDAYGGGIAQEGGMSTGFLRKRKDHQAAPVLADALTNYFQHVAASEHFKAYAEMSREMNGVLRASDVRRAIQAAKSAKVFDAVRNWATAIDQGGMQAKSWGPMLDNVARRIANAQAYIGLAWNIGTMMKHTLSAFSVVSKMPLTEYAKRFPLLLAGQLEAKKIWNANFIQRRLEGGVSPEQKAAMANSWESAPSRRKMFLEMGTHALGYVDTLATTGGAAIAYDYHYSEAIKAGMTPEMADRVALSKAEDMVARTAYPSDMTQRSLAEIGGSPGFKLLWLFATPGRQKAGLFATAVHQVMKGEATAGELARVLFVTHVVGGLVAQGISSTWRAAKDKDKDFFDPSHWKPMDFIAAGMMGPLAELPFIREGVEFVKGDQPRTPIGSMLKGAASTMKLAKAATGTMSESEQAAKDKDPDKWMMSKVADALSLAGVLIGNGWESLGVVSRLTKDATNLEAHAERQ